MAFQLGDDQTVDLTVMGVDDAGNQVPATFTAPPTWTSSDPTIATVVANPDGSVGTVVATGTMGSVSIAIAGDGGPGVTPLNTNFDIDVVATAEIGFTVTPGTAAHK